MPQVAEITMPDVPRILSVGPYTLPHFCVLNAAAPTSANYPTANKAFYIPVVLPWTVTITRMFIQNATVGASRNFDLGIYGIDGTRLSSTGSTAQAGSNNSSQKVALTSPVTLLANLLYYMAVASDVNTLNIGRFNPFTTITDPFCLEQTSAFPLPATATFSTISVSFIPGIGMLTAGVF